MPYVQTLMTASQSIADLRAKNMVVHGLPDTAAVSNTAALKRLFKASVDSVEPSRWSSPISQSISAVTCIGRPGTGSRAVLVEYSSSQAKHKTYALSRQPRQQGISHPKVRLYRFSASATTRNKQW
ncbi:TPA: hypothetical protein ACH3X3_012914 [Trebouxia sp. C0006]